MVAILPDSNESTEQYNSVRLQVDMIAASSMLGVPISVVSAEGSAESGIAIRSRTSRGAEVWFTPIVSKDMAAILAHLEHDKVNKQERFVQNVRSGC
tara:strand:- start:1211 stop:1501 length:291 start_codon:yes stop_codon:yes gene_type:complete